MMENKRINNLDKKITRFSIRKYQGFGAASVAIIGFIMMSNINYAKADSIEQNNTTINQKLVIVPVIKLILKMENL